MPNFFLKFGADPQTLYYSNFFASGLSNLNLDVTNPAVIEALKNGFWFFEFDAFYYPLGLFFKLTVRR